MPHKQPAGAATADAKSNIVAVLYSLLSSYVLCMYNLMFLFTKLDWTQLNSTLLYSFRVFES